MGWLVAGILALAANVLVGATKLAERLPEMSARMGFAFGQAAVLSLVVCGIMAFSASRRNARSMGKALFWTQIITFLLVVLRS